MFNLKKCFEEYYYAQFCTRCVNCALCESLKQNEVKGQTLADYLMRARGNELVDFDIAYIEVIQLGTYTREEALERIEANT